MGVETQMAHICSMNEFDLRMLRNRVSYITEKKMTKCLVCSGTKFQIVWNDKIRYQEILSQEKNCFKM